MELDPFPLPPLPWFQADPGEDLDLGRFLCKEEEEEEEGCPLSNLSAFILRDCMWSAAKGVSAPIHSHSSALDPGLGGLCVAPGAVLAPIAASSGSEGPSDSEGEEVDVVTVEKRQSLAARKPVTITVRADPWDPCMKHFHISIHQQQHNYAARSPPDVSLEKTAPEEEEEEEEEEENDDASPQDDGGQAAESSPPELFPHGSDGEDLSKRRNHNDLERKRRNDLRSRFLALRDAVPGLASCPKTPKVVVLSKAAEFLQSLLGAEQEMMAEKKRLKRHQVQLLKRISQLKGLR
nr:protein L-Myc [Anolis sagrei ordinatus]